MAEVIRYVNTASSGGDGTTNGTSGPTAAYATLTAWEAAEQTDLVSAGNTHVVKCSGGSDYGLSTIAGWTTGSSNDITVQGNRDTSDGFNDGTLAWSTSFYYKTYAFSGNILTVNQDYVTLDGIQVIRPTSGAHGQAAVFITLANNVLIKNCRIFSDSTTSTQVRGIVFDRSDNLRIKNNLVSGFTQTGSFGILSITPNNNTNTVYIYNNSIFDCANGVFIAKNFDTWNDDVTFNIYNNNFFDNGADLTNQVTFDLGAFNHDYNAGDDSLIHTTETNGVDISPGGTESTDWASAMTDPNNATDESKDVTVKDASSVLYQAGVGSSSDSEVPTTDLLGNARSTTAPYIGAFENSVSSDTSISATTDALVLTENSATITFDVNVTTSVDSLVLTENQVSVTVVTEIVASSDSLILTENAATIAVGVNVLASLDALSLTEQPATISLDIDIITNLEELVLVEFKVSIEGMSEVRNVYPIAASSVVGIASSLMGPDRQS